MAEELGLIHRLVHLSNDEAREVLRSASEDDLEFADAHAERIQALIHSEDLRRAAVKGEETIENARRRRDG